MVFFIIWFLNDFKYTHYQKLFASFCSGGSSLQQRQRQRQQQRWPGVNSSSSNSNNTARVHGRPVMTHTCTHVVCTFFTDGLEGTADDTCIPQYTTEQRGTLVTCGTCLVFVANISSS